MNVPASGKVRVYDGNTGTGDNGVKVGRVVSRPELKYVAGAIEAGPCGVIWVASVGSSAGRVACGLPPSMKVTVWISAPFACQVTESPASIVMSPGRKRWPWTAMSGVCEPTRTVQLWGRRAA